MSDRGRTRASSTSVGKTRFTAANASPRGRTAQTTSRPTRVRKRKILDLSPSPTNGEDNPTDEILQNLDLVEDQGLNFEGAEHPSLARPDQIQEDLQIALDFGTTYTTIAYVEKNALPVQAHTIDRFPSDKVNNQHGRQVPTELLYVENTKGEYKVLYGYEVHRWLDGSYPQDGYSVISHVRRMKHILDGDKDLQHEGTRLQESLIALKQHKRIKSNEDVIVYILQRYFEHAKRTLERDYDFHNSSTIELTFTVPVCWKTAANQTMASCIDAAMRKAQFGYFGNVKNVKFFMVNEAEAGATNALRSFGLALKRMETFVLIDAGGGTTDLGLYRIANENPLRLKNEVNAPSGAMTGSSDLNERFLVFVFRHLGSETYLKNLASIINEDIMTWFENDCKRTFNYLDHNQLFTVRVWGLRASDTNPRLGQDSFVVDYSDMLAIFNPSLRTIADLMEAQIRDAHGKHIEVDKVVLIGGFGDSPALKEFLRQRLTAIGVQTGYNIRFVTTPNNTGAAGVATGGIIRASDKRHGPDRIPIQSIGVYRHLYVDDVTDKSILEQLQENSGGTWLIRNTIEWIIKKSSRPLSSVHRVTFKSVHSFWPSTKIWRGREVLYSSDVCTKDGFQRTHANNKGKTTQIGDIVFNLTHLREWHINNMVDASPVRKKQKCLVTVLIEMIVIDRDLKFSVRWPAEAQGAELQDSVKSFTVVAAFEPGTQ